MAAEAEVVVPRLGVRIGWRPEISELIADLPGMRFCEVIAESLAPAVPPRGVAELRERGIPVIPHGVRLSLGGAEPVDADRLGARGGAARRLGPRPSTAPRRRADRERSRGTRRPGGLLALRGPLRAPQAPAVRRAGRAVVVQMAGRTVWAGPPRQP
ncbi:DUF692 family multinuclear iron-containing protein [Pseudonocardia acidicola]|uniref:DUF692 domain-containing protein n=1 Tax=Pseudonocardia acidicola TaxID=2724939 RepID=A0ABX1SHH1_9PSEU|nr:DUF692 domain-containing protein [Pseudonocardia acidicola]